MTPLTVARRCALACLALAGTTLLTAGPAGAQAADRSQTINIVQIDGAIEPAYADYIADEIRRSEREGHLAVLLRLDSPGSIKIDDDKLLRTVAEAKVPVATWVGPNDAAVSGLAAGLWLVGDVALIARDARIGAVCPVAVAGRRGDCPEESAAIDMSLRNGLAAGGRDGLRQVLADNGLVAATLREAVSALNGKEVEGRPLVVDSTQVTVRFATPGLIRRVRHTLVAPTLAYLLLVAGIGMLVFELFQPGFGPAGYAGLLTVALAAYGFAGLPVNPPFLLLVLGGLAAMTYDVARNALAVPTWAGLAAFVVGSVFLFHSNGPALRLPWPAVVLATFGVLVFFAVAMTVVLRALRGQSAEMGRALLGRIGEVRSTLNPQGHVLVEGALWRARAVEWDGPVDTGTKVHVTGVDQEALILDVEPVPAERG